LQDVTVTITGANDEPTIVAGSTTASGGVTEDTNVDGSGNISTAGIIAFRDLDLIDIHTASFTAAGTGNIGTFALTSVTEDNTDTTNTTSLGWTFTLNDNDPLLQSLTAGQTITQIYTVTVSDGNGGTVSQDITITITGTDDYDPDHDIYAVDGTTLLFPSNSDTPPDYHSGNAHNFIGAQTDSTIIGNNDGETDHINGQDGNDTIYGRGGDDNIQSGGGDDIIYAGSGNDTISAGSGNDIILGSSGADQLWGGSGNDTFVFTSTAESNPVNFDAIHDFEVGIDHIDVAGLGFTAGTSGIGTLTANSLNWAQVGSDTVILGDTDGDVGTVEFQIVLKGITATSLHLSDFTLA
jgi:VCBS repeat-containing protein